MDFQREGIQEHEVKRRMCTEFERNFCPETTEPGTSVAIQIWLGRDVPAGRPFDVIQNTKPWLGSNHLGQIYVLLILGIPVFPIFSWIDNFVVICLLYKPGVVKIVHLHVAYSISYKKETGTMYVVNMSDIYTVDKSEPSKQTQKFVWKQGIEKIDWTSGVYACS